MWVETDLTGEFAAKRLTSEDVAGVMLEGDRRVHP